MLPLAYFGRHHKAKPEHGANQMSFEAMAWAAKADCRSSLNKLVLMMLANYADEDHTAYPSYRKLAELCLCNERTVMRGIKSLEALDLIRTSARFSKSGKQTSNNFHLLVRGDISDRVRVTNNAPNTIRDIQVKPINNKGDKKNAPYPQDFEQWWKAYPRSDGSKKKAFDLWKSAVKKINREELLHLTVRFANAVKGSKFIPHATTWLNQDRWETVGAMNTHTTRSNRNQLAG